MYKIATRGLIVTGVLGVVLAIATWNGNPGTCLTASALAFGILAWQEH